VVAWMRVLIVAENSGRRATLASALEGQPSVAEVQTAPPQANERGDRFASSAFDADVVVVDVSSQEQVPIQDGQDGSAPRPAVVALVDTRDYAQVGDLIRRGVRAVLPRDATPQEVRAAVDAAAAGLAVFAPDVAALVLETELPRPATPVSGGGARLTRREHEVLGMLAEGFPNKVIAARLGISDHTVKAHIAAIFGKLEASSRADAVVRGARAGLLML
jgi:DNA-binding NarL/FixJ family response regulator